MCEMCDGKSLTEVLEGIDSRIREHGFTVPGVTTGIPGRDWAYTIGLVENAAHPELIVTGLPAEDAMRAVQAMARMVRDGTVLRPGETVRLGSYPDGRCFRMVPVHERHLGGELFAQWHTFYEWRSASLTLQALHAATLDDDYCEFHQSTANWLDNPGAVVGSSRRTRRAKRRR